MRVRGRIDTEDVADLRRRPQAGPHRSDIDLPAATPYRRLVNDTDASLFTHMIEAVETADLTVLEGLFAADIRLRASLPQGDLERSGRSEAAALIHGWFADSTNVVQAFDVVDMVGDVWHVGYRFTLREAEVDYVVEQHAYCTLTGRLITSMRLICSGFNPAAGA
jgi:hypothetical protein